MSISSCIDQSFCLRRPQCIVMSRGYSFWFVGICFVCFYLKVTAHIDFHYMNHQGPQFQLKNLLYILVSKLTAIFITFNIIVTGENDDYQCSQNRSLCLSLRYWECCVCCCVCNLYQTCKNTQCKIQELYTSGQWAEHQTSRGKKSTNHDSYTRREAVPYITTQWCYKETKRKRMRWIAW